MLIGIYHLCLAAVAHYLKGILVRISKPGSLALLLRPAPFFPAFVPQQLIVGQEPGVRREHGGKKFTREARTKGAHFHALLLGADPDCAIGVTASVLAGSTGSVFTHTGQEIPERLAVWDKMEETFKSGVFHFPMQDFRRGVDPDLDGAVSTIEATVADEFLVQCKPLQPEKYRQTYHISFAVSGRISKTLMRM